MNLLAVGHSFLGMKTQPHRYKLCEQKFLPKFAPVGRPVSLMPAPMQEKSPLSAEPLFHKKAASNPPANVAKAQSPQKCGGARAIAVSEVHSPAAEAAPTAGKPAWKIFGARPSGRAARALVQCELSLEQVKVMRNDLNDTDLKIVRVQPARQAARNAPEAPSADLKPAVERVWSRLTARLFEDDGPQL